MAKSKTAILVDYVKGNTKYSLLVSLLIFATLLSIVTLYGCDSNTAGGDASSSDAVAVLTVTESRHVPGRIEMDGSESFVIGGAGKGGTRRLVSHTYTVTDMNTGDIVFGPETLTETLTQALIKTYLPAGDYLVTLTVEAEPRPDQGTYVSENVRQEDSLSDTMESTISLDADISFGSTDCDVTCSSDSDEVACTLSSSDGCDSVDLDTDVMTAAQSLNSDIDDNTTMWIQAFGARGGKGVNCITDGGDGGKGGFAQMITTVSKFLDTYDSTTIYYYLGKEGDHASDCPNTGGEGGASTIVSTIEPSDDNYFELDNIVVLAGGGGGGGAGESLSGRTGGSGGKGGSAVSTTSAVSSAAGDDANHCCDRNGKGGNKDGNGEGGNSGNEAGDGNSGIGGLGGSSGEVDTDTFCTDTKDWRNSNPTIDDDAGEGGYGGANDDFCFGGAGGGGYGGGGGGGEQKTTTRNQGGGGGGSYASISQTSDTDAPTSGDQDGEGDVVITFNTSPND